MHFTIYISKLYLCCSTLPLLNGGISIIIDSKDWKLNSSYPSLAFLYCEIIEYLEKELSLLKLQKRLKYRLLIKEHNRMLSLYKLRYMKLEALK